MPPATTYQEIFMSNTVTIENHSEHPFHLPKHTAAKEGEGVLQVESGTYQEATIFPRAGAEDESGNPVPSKTNVSQETLERMKKNPVTRGWFKPAGGRLQLVVAEKAAPDSAPEDGTNALGGSNTKAKPKA